MPHDRPGICVPPKARMLAGKEEVFYKTVRFFNLVLFILSDRVNFRYISGTHIGTQIA
jgi:hypothetical protein